MLTRTNAVRGTPHYLSPEVADKGASEATVASDLYGLGAILYQLLTGAPTKAPEVYIFSETPRGRSCDISSDIFLAAGESVSLRGRVLDAEDGTVDPDDQSWQITGPDPRSGTGGNIHLAGLMTGTHQATLTATDRDGQQGSASINIHIAAKGVDEATDAILLDGYPDEAAWATDTHPLEIRYRAPEEHAGTVRMVQRDCNFYVSAAGLIVGSNAGQFFGITLDPDNSGGTTTQTDDLRFDVLADGRVRYLTGDGDGFTEVGSTAGIEARVSSSGGFWSVEMCIADSLLGLWDGRIAGVSVAHYHRNFSGDHTFWPAIAQWNRPSTWAELTYGPDPQDPTDQDLDGFADAWELEYFGDLKTAGSGDGDQDGDGQSDAQEFAAGTSPVDDSSRFNATLNVRQGRLSLVWQGVPARSYSIERSCDLDGWEPLDYGIPAAPGGTNTWFPTDPTDRDTFYRIRANYCR